MENHPIPQDVTGFQFRLIGDMTVKQFAYVAAGSILAFVLLYMPLNPFIKFPFSIFFALFGVGLAFLPIEGRPSDVMFGYFLKALFSPNQYVYHKSGGSIPIFSLTVKTTIAQTLSKTPQKKVSIHEETLKREKLQAYLQTLHETGTSMPLEHKEQAFLEHIVPQAIPSMMPASPKPPQAVITPQAPKKQTEEAKAQEKQANLALQAAALKHEIDEAKRAEEKTQSQLEMQKIHSKIQELEQQLQQTLAEKKSLEEELAKLKASMASVTQVMPTQSTAPPPPPQAQPPDLAQATVRKIPADMARTIGLPKLPDVPNLIIGIVKDPRGNVLPNILVEVKDKDGMPARAFRTNALGQFASATPLANGTYQVTFEDPRGKHRFDTVELVAKGEILLPLEIISHDEREELRKALFS